MICLTGRLKQCSPVKKRFAEKWKQKLKRGFCMSQIIEITDFEAPQLDIYARFTEAQLLNRHEPQKGIFIAESPKVIQRALDGGCTPISFLVEHRHLETQAKELIQRCGDI